MPISKQLPALWRSVMPPSTGQLLTSLQGTTTLNLHYYHSNSNLAQRTYTVTTPYNSR